MNTLDLTATYISVEDITDRVDELREERASLEAAAEEEETIDAQSELDEWDVDNAGDLAALESLLDGLKDNGGDHQWEGDWYPQTLIAGHEFENAMDELLEDIGALPRDLPSYLGITVDYDALRMDYTEIEIDGTTYLYR